MLTQQQIDRFEQTLDKAVSSVEDFEIETSKFCKCMTENFESDALDNTGIYFDKIATAKAELYYWQNEFNLFKRYWNEGRKANEY